MTARRILLVVLALSFAETFVHADAATDKARAREAYDRGTAAHQRGDFATAAQEYARADEIAPSAIALQAAIDEAIKADDPGIGSELLERSKRGPVTGALDASVRKAHAMFAHRAGQLRVTCPDGVTCLATVDGRALPMQKPTWARAGQHTIVIQVGDQSQQKLVNLDPDAMLEVAPATATPPSPTAPPIASTPTPVPTAPPGASAPPAATSVPPASSTPAPVQSAASSTPPSADAASSSSGVSPVVFWIGAGVTVVLGGGAAFSAIDTGTRHDKFISTGCDRTAVAGCTSLANDGKSAELRTDILIGATAAAGIATAVIGLFFLRKSDAPPPVSATIGPSGASASFRTSF